MADFDPLLGKLVTHKHGEAEIKTIDSTTNNVSTSKHGFAPKITDTAKFLKGDGTWATPTGGGASVLEVQVFS